MSFEIGFVTSSDDFPDLESTTAIPNVANLDVNLTGFNVDGGPVIFSNDIVITAGTGGGSATFRVSNARLTQILTTPIAIGHIVADIELVSEDTTADLSGFGPGSSLAITFNGLTVTSDGNDGSANISGAASASFTLSPVPEPTTLLLAALAAVGLVGFGRGRRR